MMLWSPELAVVPVTIHLPLREIVSQHLTTELIVETGRIVARDLAGRFGIAAAAARASPGSIRMPAKTARSAKKTAPSSRRPSRSCSAEGIDARGPLPADTLFHADARARPTMPRLCMYHDQALIPIKTLAFDHAVNVTLGLPFVRTSPDHGTAFDIAGTGTADPTSLVAALRLAARLGERRSARRPRRIVSAARRPAAAARGHPPARLSSPRNRSARISCSISISTARIARAAGRSPASRCSRSAPARAG